MVDTDDLMIINKSGILIRLKVDRLRVMGRATQGVRLIRLSENDEISSVEKIERLVDEVEIADELENVPMASVTTAEEQLSEISESPELEEEDPESDELDSEALEDDGDDTDPDEEK